MKNLDIGHRKLHTTPNRFTQHGPTWNVGQTDAISFTGKTNFYIDYHLTKFNHAFFTFVNEMFSRYMYEILYVL